MASTNLINLNVQTLDYTLLYSDDVVEFNISTGKAATLPTAVGFVGKRFTIKNLDTSTAATILTINTTSAQTVDGRASGSFKLSPGDFIQVVSDGTNWKTIVYQETVNAFYNGIPTGTIPTNFNTADPITYGTKVRDTHSGYSGGIYTIQSTGSYNIAAAFSMVAASVTAGNYAAIAIYKNSTTAIGVQTLRMAVSTGNGTVTNSIALNAYPLNAGDTITIFAANNNTTPSFSQLLSGAESFFSISKVGN